MLPISGASSAPPALVDREAGAVPQRVGFFKWHPDHGQQALARALTETERGILERRRQEITLAFTTFPEHDPNVAAELMDMFASFPQMRQRGPAAIALVKGVMDFLRLPPNEFPAWAVIKAAQAIHNGDAGVSKEFPPSDATVKEVVRKQMEWWNKERDQIVTILNCPVAEQRPAPEQKPLRRDLDPRMLAAAYRPGIIAKREAQRKPKPPDNNHAARVAADLAQRRQGREQHGG